MTELKSLAPYLLDNGGQDKYLPLPKLLDFFENRVSLLNNELGKHGLDMTQTEFYRGQRIVLISLIRAFRELMPGTPASGPNL
jgi:hypothetical protein